MASRKIASRRAQKQEPEFDLVTHLTEGLKDACFIKAQGNSCEGVSDGDILLIERSYKKPKDGDLVLKGSLECLTVGHYHGDESREIYGVVTAVIRRLNQKPKRVAGKPLRNDSALIDARNRLDRLELLPENEAQYFALQTEIYRLEHETDEWPEVIAA